ncbi:hypothetical protein BOX37_01820 [Nocardia mangyaensis]|uniref:Uncharacterized protein n=1 Tax=Nocardia mangyaensis TaxID=2213200 RepID=A0A1J0VLM3_9NOCA|nr:hypothetical protein [Nocardia mangyaensis]APE32911.1 hypothetical protein BOX37_01820 [Nocardia mangyaensis]MDO3650991.1 hypothetical protein [Nocardia mangyaensis]
MDIVELRTPTAILRHGRGRLTVLRPGTDGERVLDVPIADLLKVRLNRRADDAVVIEIFLRYPTPVLTGVPADRTPLPVLIAEHDVPAAVGIVDRINDQIMATQRIDVAAPDLTPPAPEWGKSGPVRADVERAVRRMAPRKEARSAVTALHRYVTPDEYVLETAIAVAAAPAGSGTGLLAATTTRLLFISIGNGDRYAYELAVPAILGARTVEGARSAPGEVDTRHGGSGMDVSDGNRTLHFAGVDRADIERVTCAVNFAVRRQAADGAAGPADPGVSQLYAEWELLVERHSLGMVDDTQFQRYGRGILRSL